MSRYKSVSVIHNPEDCEIDSVIKPGKEWRVKADGSYWSAIAHPQALSKDFLPGDQIRVVGHKGLKLLIKLREEESYANNSLVYTS